MPRLGSIKRRDLIRYLRELGFDGPYSGGKHEYMIRNGPPLILPNPHQGDLSKGLVARILRQAGINREDWEAL